ncbi:MAG: ParB/RepB/Spo0J family partition protein [Rhodospirillales bacterium]|nr:ParB/RepB/Spo0J family partition protein [Rhodospirillales bacterium]
MSAEDGKRRNNLGRGLSALFGEAAPAPAAESGSSAKSGPHFLPVNQIQPGKYQPRRYFDSDVLEDLIQSVREKGILQPLLVRPIGPHCYEIIAGERRWRAAQQARLLEVPVVVREFTDSEALEASLVENLQRQDLSPLEEAEGYQRLMEEFQHTQDGLARSVGKSRSHVANMMRLLALPEPIKQMLAQGQLTAGHARALLTAADPVALAQQVVAQGLNVRQTEKLAHQSEPGRESGESLSKRKAAKDPDTLALERDLSDSLGLRVTLKSLGKGGELTIHYGNVEQLDGVLHRLINGQ